MFCETRSGPGMEPTERVSGLRRLLEETEELESDCSSKRVSNLHSHLEKPLPQTHVTRQRNRRQTHNQIQLASDAHTHDLALITQKVGER
jgi:hypothetical protein